MAMVVRRQGPVRAFRRPQGNVLRPVEWSRYCDDVPVTVFPDTTAASILVPGPVFNEFTRPTVVRIIGHLQLESVGFSSQSATVVAGITIINPDEPPPNPIVQARGNRWLWWHCRHMRAGALATNNTIVDGVNFVTIAFDIRAMRKRLVENSQLALVVHNAPTSNMDVNYASAASVLIKE